jgi:hypothetical protein
LIDAPIVVGDPWTMTVRGWSSWLKPVRGAVEDDRVGRCAYGKVAARLTVVVMKATDGRADGKTARDFVGSVPAPTGGGTVVYVVARSASGSCGL